MKEIDRISEIRKNYKNVKNNTTGRTVIQKTQIFDDEIKTTLFAETHKRNYLMQKSENNYYYSKLFKS